MTWSSSTFEANHHRDYFVICEGDTDRQVRAITENILTCARSTGYARSPSPGSRCVWACADFDAVIAHVFLPGERTFYDLEGTLGDPAGEEAISIAGSYG